MQLLILFFKSCIYNLNSRIIAAAFAFVACSDDDGPCEKPFDGEVVSFEASEHLLDAMTGDDVKLGPVRCP